MSQLSVKVAETPKTILNDGLNELAIITTTVSEDFFAYEPHESKEEILDQLEQLGIQVTPPTSLEVTGWKESAVLPKNVHFDKDKIERIVIKQVTEGLFSLRIFTKDGYLAEQKFGQGRLLDLKQFHDLLILDES